MEKTITTVAQATKAAKKYYTAKAAEKYKSERGRDNYLAKIMQEFSDIQGARSEIICFKAETNWHKSRTWGMCPTSEVWITYKDLDTNKTEFYYGKGHASGYGYDKLSAAIEEATDLKLFHYTIKKNLKKILANKAEYGINTPSQFRPYFSASWSGKGMSVIDRLFRSLGGKTEYYETKLSDLFIWSK